MRNQSRVIWMVSFALTIAVGVFSLTLATTGLPAVSYGEEEVFPRIDLHPAPHLMIPFVGAVVAASGLLIRRMAVAWIGALILLGFSLVFGFSLGSLYVLFAGALMLLLFFLQSKHTDTQSRN